MEPISALVQSPLFIKLSGPVAIVMFVALFWLRAGSIHSVLERLWRLAAGNAEVQDQKLKRFVHEIRDLEKFRFIYGLKVDSIAELHRLLAWLDSYAIGIARAQRARRWIDLKSQDVIVSPSRKYFVGKTAVALLCVFLTVAASEIISYPSGLFETKVSKVWFLMDTQSVRHIMGDWAIDPSVCGKGVSEVQRLTGFSESESGTICKAFQDNSLQQVVRDAVKQQQWTGIAIAVFALAFLISAVICIISAEEACRIKKELDKGRDSSEKPPLTSPDADTPTKQRKRHRKSRNIPQTDAASVASDSNAFPRGNASGATETVRKEAETAIPQST